LFNVFLFFGNITTMVSSWPTPSTTSLENNDNIHISHDSYSTYLYLVVLSRCVSFMLFVSTVLYLILILHFVMNIVMNIDMESNYADYVIFLVQLCGNIKCTLCTKEHIVL